MTAGLRDALKPHGEMNAPVSRSPNCVYSLWQSPRLVAEEEAAHRVVLVEQIAAPQYTSSAVSQPNFPLTNP